LFDAALGDRFSCCTIKDGDGGWFIQWQGNTDKDMRLTLREGLTGAGKIDLNYYIK
jgi:hypothetical protein